MNDHLEAQTPIAIVCGVLCIAVGMLQALYAFLAFASVLFVDVLGIGLTLASVAVAAVPEEPYEIPYARQLAMTIGMAGIAFASVAIFTACRCFYRKRIERIDFGACTLCCVFLFGLHYKGSLLIGASAYAIGVIVFSVALLVDWAIIRRVT